MAYVDMPLAELRNYQPTVREPEDFDAFWRSTIDEARALGDEAVVTPWPGPITSVEVFDVTFPGWGGQPVKAWLFVPKDAPGEQTRRPCIVEFQGYGGGRGLPQEKLGWSAAGYVHLMVDTRGQGSGWGTGGDTPDEHGSGPAVPGMMTRGIENPHDYYYRRFFTDGVRAVDFVRTLPQVDPTQVFTAGGSQGGGTSLAVGSLVGDLAGIMADVPFLCHYERAIGLTDSFPYAEITGYLKVHRGTRDQVFETLSYFDGVNFAKRVHCPSIVSVALMDAVCPASTIFAATNQMPTKPQVEVYEFNGHEGGDGYQWLKQARWLGEVLGNQQ